MPGDIAAMVYEALSGICQFSSAASGICLRNYQQAAAVAIVQSVIQECGRSFVVLFPRQSGKNELQAQIESYLLTLFYAMDADMVKVSPTWKPQSITAMRRLERVLTRNLLCSGLWSKESGYIYRIGRARLAFFSGQPEAHIVGATASALLEIDEAQDVQIAKYDKDIAPMAASTNATRVFYGTAWTSQTLLARELRAALKAQQQDGITRVFRISADEVAAEVPAYGAFVQEQIARLGRNHPMVRTQFFSEEIDQQAGMFPPARVALMQSTHPAQETPRPGGLYALLVDVAGEDESPALPESRFGSDGSQAATSNRRDATALTIVEIDLSTISDELVKKPAYRVMTRRLWSGARHTQLYAEIKALAELWLPRRIVVDATGIGAGLASFLGRAFPGRVTQFIFNRASKSKLGWDFLSIIETGRFKDHTPAENNLQATGGYRDGVDLHALFYKQLAYCRMEIIPGPEHKIKWGSPEGARDPIDGSYLHDDLVLSAALTAVLDEQEWTPAGPNLIIQGIDPLKEMDKGW
jgi:hypothetical protein